jgi:hypothetical protein
VNVKGQTVSIVCVCVCVCVGVGVGVRGCAGGCECDNNPGLFIFHSIL